MFLFIYLFIYLFILVFEDLVMISDVVLLIVPSRYFCGGSFCFMSWCIKSFFVLLAPYVCFHILVKLR